jgi:hypothetical protein
LNGISNPTLTTHHDTTLLNSKTVSSSKIPLTLEWKSHSKDSDQRSPPPEKNPIIPIVLKSLFPKLSTPDPATIKTMFA